MEMYLCPAHFESRFTNKLRFTAESMQPGDCRRHAALLSQCSSFLAAFECRATRTCKGTAFEFFGNQTYAYPYCGPGCISRPPCPFQVYGLGTRPCSLNSDPQLVRKISVPDLRISRFGDLLKCARAPFWPYRAPGWEGRKLTCARLPRPRSGCCARASWPRWRGGSLGTLGAPGQPVCTPAAAAQPSCCSCN